MFLALIQQLHEVESTMFPWMMIVDIESMVGITLLLMLILLLCLIVVGLFRHALRPRQERPNNVTTRSYKQHDGKVEEEEVWRSFLPPLLLSCESHARFRRRHHTTTINNHHNNKNSSNSRIGSIGNETDQIYLLRHGERLDHCDPHWRGKWLAKLSITAHQPSRHANRSGVAHDGMMTGSRGVVLPSTDPPLSRLGCLQALETGLYFRSLRVQEERHSHTTSSSSSASSAPTLIVTSPYLRCVQTALLVAAVGFDHHCLVVVDHALGDFAQPKVFSAVPQLAATVVAAASSSWQLLGWSRELLIDPLVQLLEEWRAAAFVTTTAKDAAVHHASSSDEQQQGSSHASTTAAPPSKKDTVVAARAAVWQQLRKQNRQLTEKKVLSWIAGFRESPNEEEVEEDVEEGLIGKQADSPSLPMNGSRRTAMIRLPRRSFYLPAAALKQQQQQHMKHRPEEGAAAGSVAQLTEFPESRAALLARVAKGIHTAQRTSFRDWDAILQQAVAAAAVAPTVEKTRSQTNQRNVKSSSSNRASGKARKKEEEGDCIPAAVQSPQHRFCSPTLFVTHADVIDAAVSYCAPRYHAPSDRGVSVPYCSLTQLVGQPHSWTPSGSAAAAAHMDPQQNDSRKKRRSETRRGGPKDKEEEEEEKGTSPQNEGSSSRSCNGWRYEVVAYGDTRHLLHSRVALT